MYRLSIVLVSMLAGAAQASAGPSNNLFWLAGEIRGQMAVVRAQTDATFCGCREADDVYDELEDLCRRMDRFEELLSRPIDSRGDLRRLARAAERVDRQACELEEEIDDALRRLRRSGPAFGHGHAVPVLPPRHASARQFGFGPSHAAPGFAGHSWAGNSLAGHSRSVFRMNIGGLSFGVCDEGNLRVGRAAPAWPRHTAVRPIGFPSVPVGNRVHHAPIRPIGWGGDAEAATLCHQMDRLRQLTSALASVLCH